jgi:hypothetical protein
MPGAAPKERFEAWDTEPYSHSFLSLFCDPAGIFLHGSPCGCLPSGSLTMIVYPRLLEYTRLSPEVKSKIELDKRLRVV